MHTTTPGIYTVFNALTYTTQELHVTAEGAGVYAAAASGYAAAYLRVADLSDVREVLAHPRTVVYSFTPAPSTIGKARAAKLHRVLGRLGLPSSNHYGLAAAALCEPFPLLSLASLTEQEARRVWAHVCKLYPQARTLAA